ncbi:MAG: hypothetical protein AAGA09_09300 [Pseudomonadota bacterium]
MQRQAVNLIPDEMPPPEYLGGLSRAVEAALHKIENPERRKILLWTLALEFYLNNMMEALPAPYVPTVGFLHPATEGDRFGVILHNWGRPNGPIPRPREEELMLPRSIYIRDHLFPVVVRRSAFIPHTNCHPYGGRGACFAREKDGTRNLLTCAHVIGGAHQIDLEDDYGKHLETGSVLTNAVSGIDAQVIKARLKFSTPLPAVNPIASYDNIIFEAGSGHRAGMVTSVTDTRGSLDRALPARVLINCYGVGGDSGSPVILGGGERKIVGLYMGYLQSATGVTEGVCQNAAQAAHVLDIELFDR